MTVTVFHDALLTTADEVRAEAPDREVDRLQEEVGTSRDGFGAAVEQERARGRHLPPSGAGTLERGQERPGGELGTLPAEVEDEATVDACREQRSDEVLVQPELRIGSTAPHLRLRGWVASRPSDR